MEDTIPGPGPLVAYRPVKLADFDNSGKPRHVQLIARAAEFALWRFRELRFPAPALDKDGGTGTVLKITLAQTRNYRGMTSPDWDFIEISNQIREETALLTVGHEIFHRIQYSYNPTPREQRTCKADQPDLWTLVLEGGARFSEDLLVDGTNRYEYDGERWFTERRRPLFRTASYEGALSGAVYDASLFWKYVAEQHGPVQAEPNCDVREVPIRPPPRGWKPDAENSREARTQIALLEAIKIPDGVPPREPGTEPITVGDLRRARTKMAGLGTFDLPIGIDSATEPSARPAPARRSASRLLGGIFGVSSPERAADAPLMGETTWGNFLVALVLNGQSESDLRFRFQESPAFRTAAGQRIEVAANRTVPYELLPETGPGAIPSPGGGGRTDPSAPTQP